ncbi:hypothetical protein [Novosphingobium sp. SG707]|uniref:hypothetical protein n=1 Tax=Novosphingobium sp. SG707 TaxID=2586996 RepID=UPI0014484111|nr:hypothetical protein [Novosphingobium sp. SG707]NKJ03024.1 hypothetical protein [Novosphingobium sp. SG707]
MTWKISLLRTLALPLLFLSHSVPASAERPVTLEQFSYSADQGYILVWAGPMQGRKTFPGFLDFMQASPETGLTTRNDNGELRTINARAIKDAATIYYESRPLAVRDDMGLFLIALKPGRWVIGGANGTALTLGSYAFEAPAAVVTYVGKVIVGKEDGASQVPEIKARGMSPESALIRRSAPAITTLVLRRPDISDVPMEALPSTLRDHLMSAKIEADVRFNNYLSGVINRAADLGPMPHAAPVPRLKDGG